ncbi:DUF2169 domain-containing protein, partial [Acidisphaera sp. L21]|uniref:DUF2169 family type VI secretion system accessory protein n=1 Tax=Acidisphaera sp. L21 TaxID=1641851 RepID=UPI00131A7647
VPSDVPPNLSGDDPAGPNEAPSYASDFVAYKPRGDFLVAATAHAQGGSPVQACLVSIGIGSRKTLAVTGDRHWITSPLGSQPSKPIPFLTMPIGYDRAFGGPRDRRNPAGCGTDLVLPNVERPDQRITTTFARPDPAGFGPLGSTWQTRISRAGTYDNRWLEQRWPWFPTDFDWAFFNAAPPDQQFPHFRGDEELWFENLHPKHPRLRCQLPGVVARIFVERPESFDDVAARLDTIWVDPASERLVLVWRGTAAVDSPRLRPLSALCATLEPLSTPADLAVHYATFMALKDEVVEASTAAAAAARAAADQHRTAAEQRIAAARAQVDVAREEVQARIQAPNVAVWSARKKPRPSDPAAALATAVDALRARDPIRAKAMEDRIA